MRERDRRSVALAAALGLALLLVVVVAAAAIRLGWAFGWVRAIHRVAASLEVLVVLWLVWLAWRRIAVQVALALTAVLSVIGIVAGQEPPPAAAAANLLGGLALTATFAWILGRSGKSGSDPNRQSGSDPNRMNRGLTPIFLLLAVQLGLGAWLAIVERTGMGLPIHGLLAVALTALLVWAARARSLLLVLALAAPLAGFTALHYEYSAAAALVHAAAVALLVAASAYAFGRAA
jgi:hypothetical protein